MRSIATALATIGLLVGLAAERSRADLDRRGPRELDWDSSRDRRLAPHEAPIPGTHDSGSYAITSHSEWALTGKNDFGKLSSVPGFLVKPTAARWSRTQSKPIFFQFADGIRYVDLRLSNEPDARLYIEHGLRSATIDEVIADVALFAGAHPKEVLFVDFGRFTRASTPAAHATLLSKIRGSLGAYLVPASTGSSATLNQI